ncbi:oxidoreductase [Luteimicrobium album]|uniref:Oxidoreductase n=1 Tax=Luteimicrobium album TaxID=1054550 RepID=A0ABQ6HYW4_9MICO|nr:aldo/keto reductase [Luteimicrobium album]GMA22889.1 oxidoreductase [Luteimicrobium album]
MERRRLGRTELEVSSLCLGTSALGSFPEQYGYEIDEDTAVRTVERVFDSACTFLDTSNEYGHGEAERRVGLAAAGRGGYPDGFVVATKVDPLPGSADFSAARVRRSVQESRERLGLDVLPLVYLHDPEKISFEEATSAGGPVEALVELREEGLIRHLGVAAGPIDLELAFLKTGHFDVVLSHNRFTLIDQSAERLMDEAVATGVAFVNAAPFGGGMLARGPAQVPTYCYRPVDRDTLARAHAIERVCSEHGVPLAAAALQFSTRDPRVTSTVVGMSRPARVDEVLGLLETVVPDELWDALRPLVEPGAVGVLA